MDDIRATETQINNTKVLLQELRGLIGDETVYNKLYQGLDPEHYLVLRTAKELTGISTYDNNYELKPWDKVIEIENDAFGFEKNTEQYKQYKVELWRLTVDKLEKEIHTNLWRDEWNEIDSTIRELSASFLAPIVGEIIPDPSPEFPAKDIEPPLTLSELQASRRIKDVVATKEHIPTSLADRLAAAKEQCALQRHDRPAQRHNKGLER